MTMQPWTEKDKARERFLQRKSEGLVSREVYCCVSTLISDLAKLEPESDDLMNLLAPTCQTCEGTGEIASREDPDNDTDPDDIETCDDCGGEGRFEAFEHWIVSDWLARKLREQNETVVDDFHGLTVWARCTTGQGIASDGCIHSIVEELFKDELASEGFNHE